MSKKFTLTPARFKKLVEVAERGGSRDDAAKALKISRTTLWRTCKAENLESWLDENIPSRQGSHGGPKPGNKYSKVNGSEIRWLKPEQIAAPLNINRDLPHVKAATMKWRQAA